MLSSAAAVVGGLFIAAQSESGSRFGVQDRGVERGAGPRSAFCGSVPVRLPPLFHELANSTLLHARAVGAADTALGASEFLPMLAILPFMLYQLAGYGTLHFVVSRPLNWAINISIFVLIVAGYVANRQEAFHVERALAGVLVVGMVIAVLHGVLKLRRMQADFDLRAPAKAEK